MHIKGQYSTFTFRPPGVLKSSVSTSPKPRLAPVEAFPEQQLLRLAQGVDPKSGSPLELLREIQAGMLFFCTLENVFLVVKDGIDGVIITDDLHVITESTYFCEEALASQELPSLQNVEFLDEIFISFDSQWMAYDHWMGYTLSKAYLASLYVPEHIKIAVPEYRDITSTPHPISKKLYEETIDKVGIKSRILPLKDGIYKIKKLSYLWPNSYLPQAYFNFKDAQTVFSHLNKKIKYRDNLPPRFYINQDDHMEPMLQEGQQNIIKDTLKELDITPVDLSTMDFDTQISLFSQAELIVSPHRPELINILFCQNDTEILEFSRSVHMQNYIPAWPYMIASTNRIQYSFFDLDWTKITPEIIKNAINRLDSL
ncbi:glycosyltransferase 61 family protein [Commensalibacter oyaizuii]|uniref:Glycosyltransferase 61 family protein n=1 Tax=Commensalibacter oyaizuii TaxID=3043873 RepID=A0ABT6Q5L5_9PROT|nr:glycosyltransferase 61 family protein [Commensalibacter sp. TBRC 16381]MDI2091754.1 glycosyltransferase 61 family protein [Commensalibacter sp. TBRC 16381]